MDDQGQWRQWAGQRQTRRVFLGRAGLTLGGGEQPVSVHDLHATMLHLLGIDYERFTHKFQGLDARLTGVEPARVVRDILV